MFHDFLTQYNLRGMTDIQRAARYFMIIKTSYGSDVRSYGCVKKNIENATKYLEAIEKRLSTVVIENKDFDSIIKTYDKKNSLFYFDPPYFGTEKYYTVNFSIEDHQRLKISIDSIKSKFILSYNDCDYIRELYKDYKIIELDRNDSLNSRNGSRRYNELLIKNY